MNIKNLDKNKLYLIILVAIGVLLVVGVTFAFFVARNSNAAASDVDVTTEGLTSLEFTPGSAVSIHASLANFSEGDGSLSGTATSSAILKSSNSATEDYNVYFEIENNNFVYTQDNTVPEMILSVIDPNGNEVTSIPGLTPVNVTDALTGDPIKGFDVTTYTGLIKIAENYSITNNNGYTGTTQDWQVTLTFRNLDTLQRENEGKALNGTLILQDEKLYSNGAEYIIGALYDGTEGNNGIYYTNNHEYRYSGANPNNYVQFNDELWRIIGVFDENSHGREGENLIKLIKEESLGNYEFDPSNDSSWSDADGGAELKQLLNGAYYNSEVATNLLADCGNTDRGSCDFTTRGLNVNARAMIEEATWYLGGALSIYTSANGYYELERGSVTSAGTNLEWSGNIGLVYPSDYGYAASKEKWNYQLYYYNSEFIPENNWMYNGLSAWTITSVSNITTHGFSIRASGNVNNLIVRADASLNPVIYLKSQIHITSGSGTSSDPFILG